MSSKWAAAILISIIALSGFVRLWNIGNAELTYDEGLYAFRSIGYLDYLESSAQPTPIQWLPKKPLPWWLNLSMHDAPPLFFVIQHVFFGALGDSLLAARLPSALSGLGAILLIYFIARRLFAYMEERRRVLISLSAAFLLSITFAHVFVSRLSMLESVLIFFVLLNILCFLRYVEDQRRWISFGITLGLCALIKYTSIFLIPVYFVFLSMVGPSFLKSYKFYGSLLIALIMFSPVIIYNINFYNTFGHFDLQFTYLLHQDVSYWHGDSGKTQEPFYNFGENMLSLYSPLWLILAASGGLLALLSVFKLRFDIRSSKEAQSAIFILLLAIFITFILMMVGSAFRFLAFYVIPGVLLISSTPFILAKYISGNISSNISGNIFGKKGMIVVAALFAVFLGYESFYMVRSLRVVYASDFGVVKLDKYLDGIFGADRPPTLPRHPNIHLDKVIESFAAEIPDDLPPTGIIYDENISTAASLWLFSRRQYYHGIPIMTASNFQEITKSEGLAVFDGFTLSSEKPEAKLRLNLKKP